MLLSYNLRKDLKPGDAAYEKIKRSLTDFGYVDPIIWNEVTGNIVGGHQRYKVLTAEDATELQCVVVHIEKPEDEKALNIVLNKATGEWEPVALVDLLQNLQRANDDLDSTGFDAAEIDDLFSKIFDKNVKDDEPDIDTDALNAFVLPGDHWFLGRHHLVCGDATSEDDLNALMGDVQPPADRPALQLRLCGQNEGGTQNQERQNGRRGVLSVYLRCLPEYCPAHGAGCLAYSFHKAPKG